MKTEQEIHELEVVESKHFNKLLLLLRRLARKAIRRKPSQMPLTWRITQDSKTMVIAFVVSLIMLLGVFAATAVHAQAPATLCGGGVGTLPTIWQRQGSDISFNNGNVGIGFMEPETRLQVDGEVNADTVSATTVNANNILESGQLLQRRLNQSCPPGSAFSSFVEGVPECTPFPEEVGDISSVTTGTGLVGGGDQGAVTIEIPPLAITHGLIANAAVGADKVNDEEVQRRIAGECAADEYMVGVEQDGTLRCRALPSGFGGPTQISEVEFFYLGRSDYEESKNLGSFHACFLTRVEFKTDLTDDIQPEYICAVDPQSDGTWILTVRAGSDGRPLNGGHASCHAMCLRFSNPVWLGENQK